MDRSELERLSRDELVARAEGAGIERASVLTRAELVDEIVRRAVRDPGERRRARGLLGVARDLLAAVVERGLHLPDAAGLIRGDERDGFAPRPRAPLATVTLAEIYAAQGHRDRALAVLDEVLAAEPDHAVALALRARVASAAEVAPALPPEAPEPEEADGATSPALATPEPETLEKPKPMLDDAPLPERYEVDEAIVMPVDPRTVYVYWEVRESTLSAARASDPVGDLVMRVVAVSASWDGPIVETRDLEVYHQRGDWFVRDLPPGALVRAAIGWRAASRFAPLAIGVETSAPPEVPSPVAATRVVRWRRGAAPPVELAPAGISADMLGRAAETHRLAVARARLAAGGEAAGTEAQLEQLAVADETMAAPGTLPTSARLPGTAPGTLPGSVSSSFGK